MAGLFSEPVETIIDVQFGSTPSMKFNSFLAIPFLK